MSFLPIVGSDSRVLVLGSMPSQISLSEHQYYANPRNSFWWIMSQMLGFSDQLDYEQRVEKLQENQVAVWDVLHDCERPGSLDSNIVRKSEVPNDLNSFLQNNPTINSIGFNGGAAKSQFLRHHSDLLNSSYYTEQLPSTSPAYASMTKQKKLIIWSDFFSVHL